MTNKPNRPTSTSHIPTSEVQVEKIIELQKLRVQNDTRELILKEKEMENHSKYAHKLLELQAGIESKRPSENRKTFTRITYLFCAILILCMVFAGFCLYLGKEEFLYSLIKGLGYIITTIIGYFAGKKSQHKENTGQLSSVEEIQD